MLDSVKHPARRRKVPTLGLHGHQCVLAKQVPVHAGVRGAHVHRPPESEVRGLGAGTEHFGVGEGIRGNGVLVDHLLVRGERVAREAVAEAGGHEDIVGFGACGAGGEGGGGGKERRVGGVEGEEAGQEVRVAGEAEGEGEPVELEADAEIGAVEVEERGDGAEEESGGGGGRQEAAELGEGKEWGREEAEGGRVG